MKVPIEPTHFRCLEIYILDFIQQFVVILCNATRIGSSCKVDCVQVAGFFYHLIWCDKQCSIQEVDQIKFQFSFRCRPLRYGGSFT